MRGRSGLEVEQELLDFVQAEPSRKRLLQLESFHALKDDLENHGLNAEEWCASLCDELRTLQEAHWTEEFGEIAAARLSGGEGEGMMMSLDAASAAKRKGISAGIKRALRASSEKRLSLLQAVAAEYLQQQKGGWRSADAAKKPAGLASVVFASRPFGMTPAKGGLAREDEVVGYVVTSVNHNDPSKPASKLGIKVGWVAATMNGIDVRTLPLKAIQELLKELILPITIEFEKPPKGTLLPAASNASPEKSINNSSANTIIGTATDTSTTRTTARDNLGCAGVIHSQKMAKACKESDDPGWDEAW
ncbi:unnamed protein product [Polarella glacialis]|uniref:PDZ domain-containing protein n=1 Tax=Polarella glacialis TaxID=89957 RepID=A0A813FIK8_POLGL|nr:unnamed protein product [Polarella glacialis]CAE8681914.1 unnamed protein product [Polarella glacialis]